MNAFPVLSVPNQITKYKYSPKYVKYISGNHPVERLVSGGGCAGKTSPDPTWLHGVSAWRLSHCPVQTTRKTRRPDDQTTPSRTLPPLWVPISAARMQRHPSPASRSPSPSQGHLARWIFDSPGPGGNQASVSVPAYTRSTTRIGRRERGETKMKGKSRRGKPLTYHVSTLIWTN